MLYYKFLHESGHDEHSVLKSCIDGQIKFSLFTSMQDKTETFVSVDDEEVSTTLAQLIQDGCQSRDFSNLRKQLTLINKIYPECNADGFVPMLEKTMTLLGAISPNKVEMARQLLPGFVQDVEDDILKRIGIFCITKVIDNQRMWEEYADNASGFAIEYDGLDSLFVGDETHWLGARKFQHALLPCYKYRIGLSATPSRWFDDSGTAKLVAFYGNANFEFTIKDALTEYNPMTGKHFLVNYHYRISKVSLDESETEQYKEISARISKYWNMKDNDPEAALTLERLMERELILSRTLLPNTISWT